jgi:hypothetical protein
MFPPLSLIQRRLAFAACPEHIKAYRRKKPGFWKNEMDFKFCFCLPEGRIMLGRQ